MLEFCSSVSSVNLVLLGCSCWFSEGRACCADSQGSFPWLSCTALARGAGLSHMLQIALCGFCSLKAFHTTLEDENGNVSLPVSSPGAGYWHPLCPHGEAVKHFCLPGFCLHSVYTQPVTEHFISQPCHSLWSFQTLLPPVACIHTAPPGGGREVLPWVCCLLCHHSESSRPTQGSSWFMTTPIWSPLLHSLVAASFPAQMSGNSPTLRQPCSFCDSRNPEPRLSHLGFHPASPPECLSRRDDPHRSRLLKVPICTRLLYHFLKAGLWMLPPLTVYLPIYPLGFTSLHLLPCRKWSLFYL